MTTILKCKEATLALLACAIGMYNISFFTPFLSIKLKDYGISDTGIGYCFLLASFPYFVATIVCPLIFKNIPRKLQFIICFVVSGVSFMFMGPSTLVGLPDKVWIVLLGLSIIGFIQALVFIPCLPEAIETFQCKFKIVEGFDTEFDNKLSDCTASLYSLFYNFAALVGPVIGGGLY
jgi:MFS family permease